MEKTHKKAKRFNTQNMVYIGMFTAILVVLAQISISMPSGVPITLQTFGVALIGVVLATRLGVASMGLYMALGMIGVPVFAGFRGGIQVLVGPTGGFLWGFFLLVLLCGIGGQQKKKAIGIGLSCLGLVACHLLGTIQFAILMKLNVGQAAMIVSIPYLVKDLVSVILAYGMGVKLRSRLGRASLRI